MATGYGNFVSGSSYGWRVQVQVDVASESATSITFNVYGQFYNEHRILSYANGSVSGGGQSRSWNDTTRNLNSGNPGTTNFASYSVTLSKGSSARTETFSARFQVTGGFGNGTSNASVGVTVPMISYQQPHPPTNSACERVSDTQQKLTWQGDYTGMDGLYPWSNVLVDRMTDDGSWTQIATLSWSAVNYTDNGTSANHRYRYALRSTGPGGTSGRVECSGGPLYTTPDAPGSVTASKSSTSSVVLTADDLPTWAEGYAIERTDDGGSEWEQVGTTASFPWTDSAAPAGTISYRVRSYRGDLYSGYTESNSITTITPPLAPTVQQLPSVIATSSEITISWVPNHPDGSAQTQAQVEYIVGTGSAQTATVQGAATSYQLPASATASSATIKVRVRTHGLDAEWGAWSSYQTVRIAVPPSVSITSPAIDGDVVDALPATFTWTASDSTGVSSQTFELLYNGRAVVTRSLSGSVRSITLGNADYVFANLMDYAVRVTVRGGSSLATSAVRTFRTDWEEPAVPQAYVEYGDGLNAAVTIIAGEGEDLPDAVSFSVVRVVDGEQHLIADDMLNGQQALDRLPPLNIDFNYLITAYAETGVSSTQVLEARVESRGRAAVNFGSDASRFVVTQFDFTMDDGYEHGGELLHFATDDGLPIFYGTSDLDNSGSYGFTLLGEEQIADARDKFKRYSIGWLRTPDGRRQRCRMEASFSTDNRFAKASVSIDTDEVQWGEI